MAAFTGTVEWAKEHPTEAMGIGAVLAIGIFYLLFSGGSAAPATGTNIASTEAAMMQAAAQQQQQQTQLQAQLAAQNDQISGQIQLAGIQAQTQNNANTLSYQLGVDQITGQVTQAGLTAQTQQAGIAASQAVNLAQIKSNVDMAQIVQGAAVQQTQLNDQTTQAMAQYVAQTQQLISTNQSNVAIVQANDQAQVSQAYIGAQQSSSMFGGIMGLAGAALMAFA